MKGIYCFAGHSMEIESIFPQIHELCALYRSNGRPEYMVRTTRDDIDFERERSDAESRFEEREPPRCPDAYLETLAVYRKLAECLLNENILLFQERDGEVHPHAAVAGGLWHACCDDKRRQTLFGDHRRGRDRMGDTVGREAQIEQ